MDDLDKIKIFMVGDIFVLDILGGYNLGIDICWFNYVNFVNDIKI